MVLPSREELIESCTQYHKLRNNEKKQLFAVFFDRINTHTKSSDNSRIIEDMLAALPLEGRAELLQRKSYKSANNALMLAASSVQHFLMFKLILRYTPPDILLTSLNTCNKAGVSVLQKIQHNHDMSEAAQFYIQEHQSLKLLSRYNSLSVTQKEGLHKKIFNCVQNGNEVHVQLIIDSVPREYLKDFLLFCGDSITNYLKPYAQLRHNHKNALQQQFFQCLCKGDLKRQKVFVESIAKMDVSHAWEFWFYKDPQSGDTPIHKALKNGCFDIVNLMLRKADINRIEELLNERNAEGWNALERIKRLSVDKQSKCFDGVLCKMKDYVQLEFYALLSNKFRAILHEKFYKNALHKQNHHSLVVMLSAIQGECIKDFLFYNQFRSLGDTALFAAVKNSRVENIEVILSHTPIHLLCALLNACDVNGENPLHYLHGDLDASIEVQDQVKSILHYYHVIHLINSVDIASGGVSKDYLNSLKDFLIEDTAFTALRSFEFLLYLDSAVSNAPKKYQQAVHRLSGINFKQDVLNALDEKQKSELKDLRRSIEESNAAMLHRNFIVPQKLNSETVHNALQGIHRGNLDESCNEIFAEAKRRYSEVLSNIDVYMKKIKCYIEDRIKEEARAQKKAKAKGLITSFYDGPSKSVLLAAQKGFKVVNGEVAGFDTVSKRARPAAAIVWYIIDNKCEEFDASLTSGASIEELQKNLKDQLIYELETIQNYGTSVGAKLKASCVSGCINRIILLLDGYFWKVDYGFKYIQGLEVVNDTQALKDILMNEVVKCAQDGDKISLFLNYGFGAIIHQPYGWASVLEKAEGIMFCRYKYSKANLLSIFLYREYLELKCGDLMRVLKPEFDWRECKSQHYTALSSMRSWEDLASIMNLRCLVPASWGENTNLVIKHIFKHVSKEFCAGFDKELELKCDSFADLPVAEHSM